MAEKPEGARFNAPGAAWPQRLRPFGLVAVMMCTAGTACLSVRGRACVCALRVYGAADANRAR
eukprot:5313535-Prymnesium_polylepis.1